MVSQPDEYGPDEYDDEYEYDPVDVAEEWTEGQCDNCTGSTAEDLARAAASSGITPVCACAIGQGAPAEECECGPVGATG